MNSQGVIKWWKTRKGAKKAKHDYLSGSTKKTRTCIHRETEGETMVQTLLNVDDILRSGDRPKKSCNDR